MWDADRAQVPFGGFREKLRRFWERSIERTAARDLARAAIGDPYHPSADGVEWFYLPPIVNPAEVPGLVGMDFEFRTRPQNDQRVDE